MGLEEPSYQKALNEQVQKWHFWGPDTLLSWPRGRRAWTDPTGGSDWWPSGPRPTDALRSPGTQPTWEYLSVNINAGGLHMERSAQMLAPADGLSARRLDRKHRGQGYGTVRGTGSLWWTRPLLPPAQKSPRRVTLPGPSNSLAFMLCGLCLNLSLAGRTSSRRQVLGRGHSGREAHDHEWAAVMQHTAWAPNSRCKVGCGLPGPMEVGWEGAGAACLAPMMRVPLKVCRWPVQLFSAVRTSVFGGTSGYECSPRGWLLDRKEWGWPLRGPRTLLLCAQPQAPHRP